MGLITSISSLFLRKNKINATFIDPTGRVIRKKVKYEGQSFETKVNGEKGLYIVDHKFIYTGQSDKEPYSYYHAGNPQPIRWDHTPNDELNSLGFKSIIESDVIKKLFAENADKKMLMLLILAIANIAMTTVVVLILFKVIKVG